MPTLEEKIKRLPPELQREVEAFVETLLQQDSEKGRQTPKFDWAGCLKDLRTDYTSVELQHAISRWRAGEE